MGRTTTKNGDCRGQILMGGGVHGDEWRVRKGGMETTDWSVLFLRREMRFNAIRTRSAPSSDCTFRVG